MSHLDTPASSSDRASASLAANLQNMVSRPGFLDRVSLENWLREVVRNKEAGVLIGLIARRIQAEPDDANLVQVLVTLLAMSHSSTDRLGWLSSELQAQEARNESLLRETHVVRSELAHMAADVGKTHASHRKGRPGARVKRPVFIVGCGRSGTALLCNLLSEHPRLIQTKGYPDGEDHTGWIEQGHCVISGLGANPNIEQGHTGYHYCLHMDEWDVRGQTIEAMHDFYFTEVLAGDNSRLVLNKNPHLSNKVRYVRQIFPDARFIHIVRDCAPVVSSWIKEMEMQRHQILYWPETPYPCFSVLPRPTDESALRALARNDRCYPGGGILRLADYWSEVNHYIAPQLADTPEQLTRVRYEDLIAEPLETINRLLDFLELAPLDGVRLNVRADNNKKFKHHLTTSQIAQFEARVERTRAEFGYA